MSRIPVLVSLSKVALFSLVMVFATSSFAQDSSSSNSLRQELNTLFEKECAADQSSISDFFFGKGAFEKCLENSARFKSDRIEALATSSFDIADHYKSISATLIQKEQVENEIATLIQQVRTIQSESQQDISRLEQEITGLENQIKDLNPTGGNISDLPQFTREQIAELQEQITQESNDIKELEKTRDIKTSALNSTIDQKQGDLITIKTAINSSDQLVSRKMTEIRNSGSALREIDSRFQIYLSKNDKSNFFKIVLSLSFVALIVLIILVFYYSINKHEDIKYKIFTNQTGIQFITIFAILISIILFGIIEVVKGNELLGLLGAIAGYVLGKGSDTLTTQANGASGESGNSNGNGNGANAADASN